LEAYNEIAWGVAGARQDDIKSRRIRWGTLGASDPKSGDKNSPKKKGSKVPRYRVTMVISVQGLPLQFNAIPRKSIAPQLHVRLLHFKTPFLAGGPIIDA